MTKVIIDPGHGGKDPGAVADFYRECDQVLAVAKRLNEILCKRKIETVMTRTCDEFVSLEKRTITAQSEKGRNIFISLHMNASVAKKATGFETYIQKRAGKESIDLQSTIHDFVSPLLRKYRLKDRGEKKADFYVIKNSPEPAILIELLFIDADMRKIEGTNFYSEVATSIANAIEYHIISNNQKRSELKNGNCKNDRNVKFC